MSKLTLNIGKPGKKACADCLIRERALCSRCSEEELAALERIKTYRDFRADDPVAWRGEPVPFVATVTEGVARLSKTMEDGRTQTVGLLLPGDFLCHPLRGTCEFDISAASDLQLCCFPRGPFLQLLEDTPSISRQIMSMALDELDAARDWMVLLGRKTAREKIATFLDMIARRQMSLQGILGGSTMTLPMGRAEIGDYLGLTIETVSRQLSVLKRDGVIRFEDQRKFRILDAAALHDATGDDADGGTLF